MKLWEIRVIWYTKDIRYKSRSFFDHQQLFALVLNQEENTMVLITHCARTFAERWAAFDDQHPIKRLLVLLFVVGAMFVLSADVAFAQNPVESSGVSIHGNTSTPLFWFLLVTSIAFLTPIGFILIAAAGLEVEYAWNAVLGGLAAVGFAIFGYWAVGFALHFGGVGLVYPDPGVRQLVWEWSPLSTNWGTGWGVAGLSGWFLSGPNVSTMTYTLFLTHLPWVVTAAALPTVALRGRAPAVVTLLIALLIGSIVYPLAGNWVQGGGWLSALGRNLGLGHGLVDFGGAGTVHLVSAGFALAALVVWIPRQQAVSLEHLELPAVHLPILVVVGSLLVFAGSIGWQWANPLQVDGLGERAMMRGSINTILIAAGGLIPPLLYTWFVTGYSDPMTSARGLVAGVVAGLAVGPFVQPSIAFTIGLLVGASVPFSIFVIDRFWRLDDATGVIAASGAPAVVGLLLVGIFADGVVGSGWQMTGLDSYLGVAGQGVSGLFVASGYQFDFPGQLQAQAIGILALSLWGFLTGMICCIPLGLLFHALDRSEQPVPVTAPGHGVQPLPRDRSLEFDQLNEEWTPVRESEDYRQRRQQ